MLLLAVFLTGSSADFCHVLRVSLLSDFDLLFNLEADCTCLYFCHLHCSMSVLFILCCCIKRILFPCFIQSNMSICKLELSDHPLGSLRMHQLLPFSSNMLVASVLNSWPLTLGNSGHSLIILAFH